MLNMTKEQLAQINPAEILLIDIRTDGEVEAEPGPKGAIHIPMQTVVEQVYSGQLPKDKTVVTVCRSGGRCMMLHQFLLEHGYQADYLEGGMMALGND